MGHPHQSVPCAPCARKRAQAEAQAARAAEALRAGRVGKALRAGGETLRTLAEGAAQMAGIIPKEPPAKD